MALSVHPSNDGDVIELTEPHVWTLIGVFAAVMIGGQTMLVAMVRAQISGLRGEMRAEIGGLRSETRAEIGGLRGELQAEIGGLRGEMRARFERVDAQFETVDTKLEQLDRDVQLLMRREFDK